MIEISGVVRSGSGRASEFTQLAWVRSQFLEKLGFDPFPGTLNIQTNDSKPERAARSVPAIVIEPQPGFCAARCYHVRVNNRVSAVWMVPEVIDYPSGQIELMAPFSLRELLRLKDGDEIHLEITV